MVEKGLIKDIRENHTTTSVHFKIHAASVADVNVTSITVTVLIRLHSTIWSEISKD